jgi:hypothetical protein
MCYVGGIISDLSDDSSPRPSPGVFADRAAGSMRMNWWGGSIIDAGAV